MKRNTNLLVLALVSLSLVAVLSISCQKTNSATSPYNSSSIFDDCTAVLEELPSDALILGEHQSENDLTLFTWSARCQPAWLYEHGRVGIRDVDGEYYNIKYSTLYSAGQLADQTVTISFHYHNGMGTYLSNALITGELIISSGECALTCNQVEQCHGDGCFQAWNGTIVDTVPLLGEDCKTITLPYSSDSFFRFELSPGSSGTLPEYGDASFTNNPFTISITPS